MRYFFWVMACWLGISSLAWAQEFTSSAGPLRVVTVAEGLEHPWSLAFLPDGRMLVTERPGRLRIVSPDGVLSAPLSGLPQVYARGQGGLLDVVLSPQFAERPLIYFSFAEERDGVAGTAVAQAELKGNALENVRVIFRQEPKVKGQKHWGSRLVWARDGTLFVTLGERADYSERAQDLTSHLGKVVRIQTDGSPALGNPFLQRAGALKEIWSYGHRNIQGAALNPDTGELWTVEHGPRGGDEVNITAAGANYGWPEASYGSHYTGWPIPDEHASRGFHEPLYHWTPSVSPSGLLFYTGDRFPAWRGSLFVGALSDRCLIRLSLADGKVTGEERLLKELDERVRDVRQGPDGWIYLLTDNNKGRILRLETASPAGK